jgi:hypothetical protein
MHQIQDCQLNKSWKHVSIGLWWLSYLSLYCLGIFTRPPGPHTLLLEGIGSECLFVLILPSCSHQLVGIYDAGKLGKLGYSWCIHGSVAELVHNSGRASVAVSGEDPRLSLFLELANCASLDMAGACISDILALQIL